MGQNPNPRPQPPKAPPRPRGRGGDIGDGGDEPLDFCLMTHTVDVALDPDVACKIGDAVDLGLANPPTVTAGGSRIGELDDTVARGLTRCLTDGYRLGGRIDSIDLEGRRAKVTLSGSTDRKLTDGSAVDAR